MRAAETEDPQDIARAERLSEPYDDLLRELMELSALDDEFLGSIG